MMSRKWFRVMLPLLLVLLLAAPGQSKAMESITARVPFTVEYAPGTVVMEPVDGAPAPVTASFTGEAEGVFEVLFTKPGNYLYRIYQQPGPDAYVHYDAAVYTVELSVMVDKAGAPYAAVTVSEDGSAHKPERISFVNEQGTGGLSVTKTVKGTGADTARAWHFTITLSEKADRLYSGVWFDTGVGHITLKHGETVTVEGIPSGTTYTITEDEADASGYVTTSEGATGEIGDGTVTAATFTNEYRPSDTPVDPTTPPTDPTTPPDGPTNAPGGPTAAPSGTPSVNPPKTGDESMLTVWIGLAAFSLVAIAVLLLTRKRRSTDRRDR